MQAREPDRMAVFCFFLQRKAAATQPLAGGFFTGEAALEFDPGGSVSIFHNIQPYFLVASSFSQAHSVRDGTQSLFTGDRSGHAWFARQRTRRLTSPNFSLRPLLLLRSEQPNATASRTSASCRRGRAPLAGTTRSSSRRTRRPPTPETPTYHTSPATAPSPTRQACVLRESKCVSAVPSSYLAHMCSRGGVFRVPAASRGSEQTMFLGSKQAG